LIVRKIITVVATRCQIVRLKCTSFDFGHRPRWGAYCAPPDPLAGFKRSTTRGREGRGGGEEEEERMEKKGEGRERREEGRGKVVLAPRS